MSAGSRAALRSARGSSPITNLVFGIILITVGIFQETERYKALSIITGIAILLTPVITLFSGSSRSAIANELTGQLRIDEENRLELKYRKRKNILRNFTILSYPTFGLLLGSELLGLDSQLALIGFGIIFMILLVFMTLGPFMWYSTNKQWKKIYPAVLGRELLVLSAEELRHRTKRLRFWVKLITALWLILWAANWIIWFATSVSGIWGMIWVGTLSGFGFMAIAINLWEKDGLYIDAMNTQNIVVN